MAQRGPKPTPTSIRTLNGDHHKSRYNLNEPQFADFCAEPPEWITSDPAAIEFWWWAAPRLSNVGVLTDGDTKALEVLCKVYSAWRDDFSMNKGRIVMAMLSEFGLTPSSRTRLVGKLPHEQDADPISARLSR